MNEPNEHRLQCERCGDVLDKTAAVWLELSNTDGRYYGEGKLPTDHVSQGCFPFGAACAKKTAGNYNQRIRENRRRFSHGR